MKTLKLFFILALAGAAVSCAEIAGSGTPVAIPTVVVDCTTADCQAGPSQIAFVYITDANCSIGFLGGAAASSSAQATCGGATGCRVTMTSWISGTSHETTTQVPSGTYTVCGYIDMDSSDSPTTADTTIEIPNVSFVQGMGVLQLGGTSGQGTWVDH